MKHHMYNRNYKFVQDPVEFNKHTPKEFLQYCLGATLYMPATKDFARVIVNKEMLGLTSMVMCFEDAIKEDDVPAAEKNALSTLEKLLQALENGLLEENDIPLIFFRVRNPEQFRSFAEKIKKEHLSVFCGFVFPKFNTINGILFYNELKRLIDRCGGFLYGMPILEGRELAFKESRYNELMKVKTLIDSNKDYVLNVRVGATDFSSCFGVRRGIDYTIYDMISVREILMDILNFFSRDNEYVVSGPVWEYFLANKSMKFKEDIPTHDIQTSLLKHEQIVNEAVDGLLREVILDKANGFVGKTIIHPTHLKYVNALQSVIKEEYDDAVQILNAAGGVVKSTSSNKMNEIRPHRSWAQKIVMKAKAYGVINDESCYATLFD